MEKEATIKDLKFDDKNFNKHTQFGMGLIEKSLRENGAGRSILLDKDNNIIAGNGVVESAGQIGLEKIKIVETTGDEIVAVKRTDVSLNSKKGREMALADNATASADLEWDEDLLKSEFDDDELGAWGISLGEIMLKEEAQSDETIEPEPTMTVFVVSIYAREKNGGSTILAQALTPEVAEKLQKAVELEGGAEVINKLLKGIE